MDESIIYCFIISQKSVVCFNLVIFANVFLLPLKYLMFQVIFLVII